MQEEVLPYQSPLEDGGSAQIKSPNKLGHFMKKSTVVNLIGFLLGRASILGGLTPFGVAFYAALSGTKTNMLALFLSINVGILTIGTTVVQFKYVLATILFAVTNIISPPETKKGIITAVRVFASIFVIGSAITFYKGFLLYDFVLNIFEAFIGFVLVLLFKAALPFLDEKKEARSLTNEQIISITILGVLAVTGITNITVLGLSIRNLLIITLIIAFALRNGAGVGAAIGLVSGLIISMSTPLTPLAIGAYGFCGLMAGVFKDLGKVGSILGFFLANSIITIYINGSTEVLINLIDIAGAALIVGFMPRRFLEGFNDYFIKPGISLFTSKSRAEKIKDITTDKLYHFADSFSQLAKTFNKISEKNLNINKEDVSTLFDEVAERVCKNCSLNTKCWNKEFYNTYQTMFNILEKLEQKGSVISSDVPSHFRERCTKLEEFVKNINFMFEIYSVNLMWQKKIGESRSLVSQQLEGVSKIIAELAEEINVDIFFKTDLEQEIHIELAKNNILVDEVMVVENRYGKYEVSVAHKPCQNKRVCSQSIVPAVNKVLKRRMVKDDVMCNVRQDKDMCVIRLSEQQNYKVILGASVSSKDCDSVCGDNHSIIQLKDGKYIVALSDGMGSGDRASQESSAAIAILEKFLESGFDKDLSIKLINSILVLKSAEESFATIDLSIIDLFTGEVEFAKIGAASTFIKRPHKVEVVKSTSLPVGILNSVDVELTKKNLEDGDIVIMVTDGVLDAKRDILRKEDWIIEELMKVNSSNPQEIADYLMEKAKGNTEGEQDDMTVLVAKVLEKVS